MVTVYVLVVTDPQTTRSVAEALRNIPRVNEVYEVMGPYDILVKCVAPNLQEFQSVLGDKIRQVQNIVSTVSLVTFPD